MSEDLDDLFLSPIPAPSPAELQQCILFGFRRRLCPTQIVDECRSAFGPFAPSSQYVAKWYQRFQDGFFNTNEDADGDAEEESAVGRLGCGQTPTTCSDYDDDEVAAILPLVLNDIGHGHSPNIHPIDINAVAEESEDDDDDHFYKDNNDDDDDLDGHVIGYWQGYGYLGGKRSGISISALPPLPKSLIGFNKLLGSDSGLLLSDGDAEAAPPAAAPERLNNNTGSGSSSSRSETNQKHTNIDINLSSQHKREANDNNDNKIDKSSPKATAPAAPAAPAPATATATLEIITPSNLCENGNTTITTSTLSSPAAARARATNVTPAKESSNLNTSTLDDQIATLRKEMNGLRQLDLSLLSQLWVLNESIQEFRAMIEEQENEDEDEEEPMGASDVDAQRNQGHSPSPSSYESVSSEGGGADVAADIGLQTKAKCLGTIPKVITTQPKIIRELISQQHQEQQDAKQKPVPRMRSAPPPPPPTATTERKPTAPPRPT
ncbi:kinesin-related protein 7 [Drosophila madeirensis]|uniref:Kinesin-related protein 7 n=1 Tax=Drosophila madeirensis TaxID=30013 RepID=A0AAU9F961_DROMD